MWLADLHRLSAKLQYPCHLYFLASGKVCKYGLVTKATGAFMHLPATNKQNRAHESRYMIHSAKQHAWLVFCESLEAPDKQHRSHTWEFTLIRGGVGDQATWFLPGKRPRQSFVCALRLLSCRGNPHVVVVELQLQNTLNASSSLHLSTTNMLYAIHCSLLLSHFCYHSLPLCTCSNPHVI